jgi:hypothetical protein
MKSLLMVVALADYLLLNALHGSTKTGIPTTKVALRMPNHSRPEIILEIPQNTRIRDRNADPAGRPIYDKLDKFRRLSQKLILL